MSERGRDARRDTRAGRSRRSRSILRRLKHALAVRRERVELDGGALEGRWRYSTELAQRATSGGARLDARTRRPRDPTALELELAAEASAAFERPLELAVETFGDFYAVESARRADADDDASGELERLAIGLTARWSSREIGRVVDGGFERLTEEIDDDLAGQVERVVGVRPDLAGGENAQRILRDASRGTIRLMEGVLPGAHERMSEIVLEGFRAGSSQDVIARRLERAAGIGRRRAAFVARNEAGNLYAAHTELRNRELGVEHYIWRTSQDERVRASHAEKEGQRFAWDDPPPDTGPPGADYNCRCTAEPDLEGALGELLGEGEGEGGEDLPPEAFIKGWREQAGLTQKQLAERLGRSSGYVSRLERGLTTLDDDELAKLRAALAGEGLDEEQLDRILGELADDDPMASLLGAFEVAETVGPTGAPQMTAAQAIARLEAASDGGAPVRGAELVADSSGQRFSSFAEVRALIDARRRHEEARFGFGENAKEIARLERQRDLKFDRAFETGEEIREIDDRIRELERAGGAAAEIKDLREYAGELRDTLSRTNAEYRELSKQIRELESGGDGGDFDAMFASLADETEDPTPLAYETGRLRDTSSGKLYPEGKTPGFYGYAWDPKAKLRKVPLDQIDEGLEDFGRFFGDAKGARYAEGKVDTVRVTYLRDRAFALESQGFERPGDKGAPTINTGRLRSNGKLGKLDFRSTQIHEMGHIAEDVNPALGEAAKRYLLGKARELGVSATDIYPGKKPPEIGFKIGPGSDGHYLGKLYPKGKRRPRVGETPDDYEWSDISATEVITMGIQEFVSKFRAKKLLENNPDLFWFAVCVSRGDFR